MTDGDGRAPEDMTLTESFDTGREVGYREGYAAARAEINRSWRESSTWRPGVTEEDAFVTVGPGDRVKVMGWRERDVERMRVIEQAHAGGVHVDIAPALGCPWCAKDAVPSPLLPMPRKIDPISLRDIRRQIGDLTVRTNEGFRVRGAALTVLFNAENTLDSERDAQSQLPHNGDYGVVRSGGFRTRLDDRGYSAPLDPDASMEAHYDAECDGT